MHNCKNHVTEVRATDDGDHTSGFLFFLPNEIPRIFPDFSKIFNLFLNILE